MNASDDTPGKDFPTDEASADALERMLANRAIRANQSELFQWFSKNHVKFAAVIDGVTRPAWLPISMELHRLGITNADGSPLTPEYVRKTWWKVRTHRTKTTRTATAYDTPPPPPPEPTAVGEANSRPSEQAVVTSLLFEPDVDDEEPFVFTFADGSTKTVKQTRSGTRSATDNEVRPDPGTPPRHG